MQKSYLKKWLFISLIIIFGFGTAGAGLTFAYKKSKLAQASATPAPTVTIAANQSLVNKWLESSNNMSGNYIEIDTSDTWDIIAEIKGRKDTVPGAGAAEVMFVIDRSLSMSRGVSGDNEECVIHIDNDPSKPSMWKNTRLCYAKKATSDFIDKVVARKSPIKIGYQLFSSYGETIHNDDVEDNGVRFWSLTDVANDPTAASEMKKALMGAKSSKDYQMTLGTAIGPGIEKATRELVTHGDPNAAKYIILLSDGAEHYEHQPAVSVSGCRYEENGNWPSGWPQNPAACSEAGRFQNICGRLTWGGYQNIITKEMITWDYVSSMAQQYCNSLSPPRSPCVIYCNEIHAGAPKGCWNNPDPFCNFWNLIYDLRIISSQWQGSPAQKAQENGVKVFATGFYGGDVNNPWLMRNLARNLYPQTAGAEPGDINYVEGYYCNLVSYGGTDTRCILYQNNFVKNVFNQIYNVIMNQNRGAAIHIEDTLPTGSNVNAAAVSVERSGTAITNITKSVTTDGQGRRKVIVDIPTSAYFATSPPEEQTFTLKIRNITAPTPGCHDADQNFDGNVGTPLDPQPSVVTWTFHDGSNIFQIMPFRQVCVKNPYSGDIYSRTIESYAFNGIDVSVAQGANSAQQVVWNLSEYDFSNSSYSNYGKFVSSMEKMWDELFKRRFRGQPLITTVLSGNNNDLDTINGDKYADGLVFYYPGDVAIEGTELTIGRGNKTIIINGNLTIASSISKGNNSGNVLFLTNPTGGNPIIISASAGKIDAAMVAPRSNINIANSANMLFIKGLMVAANVNLKPQATSNRQRISYDPDLVLSPPPGLSSIELPIFYERAP